MRSVPCATEGRSLQIQALAKGRWMDSSLPQHLCFRLKSWQRSWFPDMVFGYLLDRLIHLEMGNSPSLQAEVAEPQINITRLFCVRKTFPKEDHPSVSGSLGSGTLPPPFNICMATVYYTSLTWWVVSTSTRKLLLNIVIFISRWAGAHSTR